MLFKGIRGKGGVLFLLIAVQNRRLPSPDQVPGPNDNTIGPISFRPSERESGCLSRATLFDRLSRIAATSWETGLAVSIRRRGSGAGTVAIIRP